MTLTHCGSEVLRTNSVSFRDNSPQLAICSSQLSPSFISSDLIRPSTFSVMLFRLSPDWWRAASRLNWRIYKLISTLPAGKTVPWEWWNLALKLACNLIYIIIFTSCVIARLHEAMTFIPLSDLLRLTSCFRCGLTASALFMTIILFSLIADYASGWGYLSQKPASPTPRNINSPQAVLGGWYSFQNPAARPFRVPKKHHHSVSSCFVWVLSDCAHALVCMPYLISLAQVGSEWTPMQTTWLMTAKKVCTIIMWEHLCVAAKRGNFPPRRSRDLRMKSCRSWRLLKKSRRAPGRECLQTAYGTWSKRERQNNPPWRIRIKGRIKGKSAAGMNPPALLRSHR